MAARLLVAVVALLAAADGQTDYYTDFFDWQGPARGCVERPNLPEYVDCALPSANLTLNVYSDGEARPWLRIFCQQNSTVVCEELLSEAQPLVEQYVVRAAERPLEKLQVWGCALPAAPLRCLLGLAGSKDVRMLALVQANGPLLAEHVAGLVTVQEPWIDYNKDDGAAIHDVPWDALRELPALRTVVLSSAAARLPALPTGAPLPLQSLDLWMGTLTALPAGAFRLAPNLTSLELTFNGIETVHEDAFVGLSQLDSVNLRGNRLSTLPAGLFRDTTRLSRLQLSDNELGELPAGVLNGLDQFTNRTRLAALPARLLHGVPLQTLQLNNNPLRLRQPELLHEQRMLQELDLTNTSLEELPEELFRHANSLRVLRLTRNSLRALGKTLFKGAPSLQELYLDYNQLVNLLEDTFSGLARLTTLSLSHNALLLSRDHNTQRLAYMKNNPNPQSPFRALQQLQVLDLSHNRVSLVCRDWRLTMMQLRKLDLSYNELEQLPSEDMYFLSRALVDVTHNRIARFVPRVYDSGSYISPAKGATFEVGYNPFECDCHMYELVNALRTNQPINHLELGEARCAGPPNLKDLLLQDLRPEQCVCNLDSCPSTCSCRRVPARQTLELDCNGVPDESVAEFESFAIRLRVHRLVDLTHLPQKVELVDMSSLNLTEPPLGGANVRIDLRGNRLREVPVELLRSNCSLLLGDNPLDCSCSAQAGIAELLRNRDLVVDYGTLRCAVGDTPPAEAAALCAAHRWATLGGALGALALTTAVLAFIAHRYRAELRILLRRLGLWRADDDSPYEYDAFVSFAHQDQQFVMEQLVPRLEAGPRPLRLCLHYRDWVVGEFIPAQISSSVERSRRTIVVLSRHFLRSMWAQLEFRAAHGRSRLVLLLLDAELAADRSLDPELRAYIAVNTYVRADDPLVWGRLRDAVLTRRRTFAERLGPERPVPAAPPLSTNLTANSQM